MSEGFKDQLEQTITEGVEKGMTPGEMAVMFMRQFKGNRNTYIAKEKNIKDRNIEIKKSKLSTKELSKKYKLSKSQIRKILAISLL